MSKEFIFIFSPNNSGTTVMSQYLHSVLPDSYLPPFGNHEGQMAPKVKRIMRDRPWEEGKNFDWNFIKNEWISLMQDAGKSIFIDASPPNIMRVDSILDAFRPKRYVFSISSPYSYVSSHIYNYVKESPSEKSIKDVFAAWKMKATKQIENSSKHNQAKIIKYEDFCANPAVLRDVILANESKPLETEYMANNHLIQGKANSSISQIIDMTPKHLAFLGTKGILYLNRELENNKEILDYFGYKILDTKEVNSLLTNDMLLALDGLKRRMEQSSKQALHSP